MPEMYRLKTKILIKYMIDVNNATQLLINNLMKHVVSTKLKPKKKRTVFCYVFLLLCRAFWSLGRELLTYTVNFSHNLTKGSSAVLNLEI